MACFPSKTLIGLILCPLFLLPSLLWGQTGTLPRQIEAVDTISTGDTLPTYENYVMVSKLDTIGIDDYRYHHRRLVHDLFIKDDSVCYQLLQDGDTVCVKIDTLNVIYGDPSDTSYYFQLQINGGLIDSMTHMELWQINQGANITLNYDGTALTVSADSCLQRLEQLTDSTFRITDCDGNPLDTMLLPGGGGTDDQEITQFEISNDTIYLTLEDGGGQKFLVVEHPDTCFHSAEAVTDSSFQILDCNGVPLDTVTLRFPGGGTDTHFANTNLSATANRSHNWKNYQFFLDSASYYGIRQSTVNGSALFQLDGFGTFQLTSNSTFPSLFQTYGRTDFISTNSSIFFDVAQSLWFISDDTNYVFDPTPSLGTDEYVLTVAAPGTTSNIGVRAISDFEVAPDSLEYRGDSIAIIGSNALRIYDLIDTSSFGDTDTRIDSLRQINVGVLDSVWLYRNDLSDSLLMVFNDSVGMDPDWYLIDDTVPPGTIGESIWTNGRVRIGQDSLENAFTVLINGGIAPFEMVSSAPTNIMRQRHRTEGTAWDHSYQAGVYSIISQNLNTAESGYYISMPEGYVGDATRPLVRIDSSDIGFWKYPSSRNDVTSVDSISALYYPAYDGEIRIAPIDSVLKRLDRDSTTHRDFDFLLLAEGDTLGTNLDSLIPDDSLDLYNLIWHGGQVRLHNTEWGQRYDTLAFGPTDSTTALQIMGERDAIDIYHNFYPYIWMRNAKADAHWRLHNNDNTVDSFPAYMELGFTSWYDSTGTAYLRDTSSRWPLRISSQSNHRAFVLERDSLILGDYKSSDVDTSLTVADLAGSAFYMPSATGKVQLVSPDTVNAFLNVVSSNPDIAFWGFKQDSFGINFLGDADSTFADFSKYNNDNITLSNDTLYLGDEYLVLPLGSDLWTDGGTDTYLTATGDNVAIGTTSAAGYKLFVQSGGIATNQTSGTGNAYVDFLNSGDNADTWRIYRNQTGDLVFGHSIAYSYSLTNFPLFLDDGAPSNSVRVNAAGVGILESNPAANFHVDGTIRFEDYNTAGDSGTPTHFWGPTNANGDLGVFPITDININDADFDPTNELQDLGTTGTESLTISGGTGVNISELIEDMVGEMVNGGTESGITVGYSDNGVSPGKLDFTVSGGYSWTVSSLDDGQSESVTNGFTLKFNGTNGASFDYDPTTDQMNLDPGDGDATNELQDLSANTESILISDGTGVNITEMVEDFIGAMAVGGTQSGITVTYDDNGTGAGALDFSVSSTGDEMGSTVVDQRIVYGRGDDVVDQDGDFLWEEDNNVMSIGITGTIDNGSDELIGFESDRVKMSAGGSENFRATATNTNIANDAYIGEDEDEQLRIQTGGSSYVEMGHEGVIANAYMRFNDNGNINIIGNGSFISIDAGSSSSSEVIIDGNIQLGPLGSNGSRVITVSNGTAPTTSPANAVQVYAQDISSSSELRVRDEAGNITTLSPHNFSKIPEGPSEEMAWSYYSERDGKYINVDMLKLARLVEELTGEKLVYTNTN